MNKYVIAAGGSGALCVQGLIHMAASGCLKREDIYYILLIDQDRNSDAVSNCQKLIANYEHMRKMMGSEGGLVMPQINLDGWGFSQQLVDKWNQDNPSANPLSNSSAIKLKELLNPRGDKDGNVLLDLLFSRAEQNENLDNGFYGHPCIGSAVFMYVRDRLFSDSGPFMEHLLSDMKNLPESHLLVYGSLFGGTGASVIPNVVLALLDKEQEIITQRNAERNKILKVGGVFLLPYFNFPTHEEDEQHLNPSVSRFEYQTKEALNYYHTAGIGKRLECMCLVGAEHLDVTTSTYSKGGKQGQHAHIVTLAAAVAGVKFLNGDLDWKPSEEQPQRPAERLFTWKVAREKGNKSLDMDALGMTDYGIDRKMLPFLGFAVLIQNYLNYVYNGREASEADLYRQEIIIEATKNQQVPEGEDILKQGVITRYYKNEIARMAEYCRSYMEFVRDVALSGYDWSGGQVNFNAAENRFVDILNIPVLESNLTLDQKSEKYLDALRANSLKQLTTFKTLDEVIKEPAVQAEDIVDTYQDALDHLPIKKGFPLKKTRKDVKLSQILQQLYEECIQ